MFWICLVLGCSVAPIELTGTKGLVESGHRVTVDLSWTSVDSVDYYMLYRKKIGNGADNEWQSISTLDLENNETVKVLNAYPNSDDCNSGKSWTAPDSNVTFANGTRSVLTKSAGLKLWMEGGVMDNTKFKGIGVNQITGEQFVTVDAISVEYLKQNPTKIWDYDVVAFGSWDGSGLVQQLTLSCNHTGEKLLHELKKYKRAGFGLITSHDTIGVYSGTLYGLGVMRDDFMVKVGGKGKGKESEVDVDESGVPMVGSWRTGSTIADIVKRGQVIDYPWTFDGTEIEVFFTHTHGNLAVGDIWMTLRWINKSTDVPIIYNITGYPEGCDTAYLSTKNNTAMIQTGHTGGRATEDEQKIWANLIYSLKQRTQKTAHIDHGCIDEEEPYTPECSCTIRYENAFDIKCDVGDRDTLYAYRVEGYNEDNILVGQSQNVEVNTASTFSHVIYRVDNGPTIATETLVQTGTKASSEFTGHGDGKYLHIVAVDQSGNISPVRDYDMTDKCVTIFTQGYSADNQFWIHSYLFIFITVI